MAVLGAPQVLDFTGDNSGRLVVAGPAIVRGVPRLQGPEAILRSLAWSFAGSEQSGTGPLTHMTR